MSQLTPPFNQTIPKEESRRKRLEEVRGCKGKYEEVLEEWRGPRVPRSTRSKVQGSQGPRYLKLRFKRKFDSKEGPSCLFNIQSRMQFEENQPCSNKFYDTRSWGWDGVHRSLKSSKCHILSVAMRNLIFCSYGIMQFGCKIFLVWKKMPPTDLQWKSLFLEFFQIGQNSVWLGWSWEVRNSKEEEVVV